MKLLQPVLVIQILLLSLAGCQEEERVADVPDAELKNTLWVLESMEVPGERDILVGSTATVNIQFSKDNRLKGISFCNAYGSSYTLLEDNKISIGSIGTTKKGCESEEKHHAEDTYYWALPLVYSYEIEGNVLRLYYDSGSVLKYRNLE